MFYLVLKWSFVLSYGLLLAKWADYIDKLMSTYLTEILRRLMSTAFVEQGRQWVHGGTCFS